MTDVSFNEETSVRHGSMTKGGMAAWIVRNKFAKDEKSANYLLIGVVLLSVGVSMLLLLSSKGSSPLDAQERARLEQSTRIPQP